MTGHWGIGTRAGVANIAMLTLYSAPTKAPMLEGSALRQHEGFEEYQVLGQFRQTTKLPSSRTDRAVNTLL